MTMCYDDGILDLMKFSLHIINIPKEVMASYCTFLIGISN